MLPKLIQVEAPIILNSRLLQEENNTEMHFWGSGKDRMDAHDESSGRLVTGKPKSR